MEWFGEENSIEEYNKNLEHFRRGNMEWFDEEPKNNTDWYEETGTVKATEKRIKVIGVGGGGGNTVSSLFDSFHQDTAAKGIDFIIMNSDTQDLSKSNVPDRIQIAQDGQGAGSDPELGKKYAEKCAARIKNSIQNAYMVFVTAGMGGGTGTGASPVVARLAREVNPEALIIGVVTTPFSSKKNRRKMDIALKGIEELQKHVNALLVVENDAILKLFPDGGNYSIAMRATDIVLMNAIRGIVGIINNVGEHNADFRDIFNIMKEAGKDVIIGVGSATGKDRYREALEKALNSPLLCGRTINGAKGVIVNFRSSKDHSDLNGVKYVRETLCEMADPNATYKDCTTEDSNPKHEDMLVITVIATDFVDERGNLVTYMKRAVAAYGVKTVKRTSADSQSDSNETAPGEFSVIEPDFSTPTFLRTKKDK